MNLMEIRETSLEHLMLFKMRKDTMATVSDVRCEKFTCDGRKKVKKLCSNPPAISPWLANCVIILKIMPKNYPIISYVIKGKSGLLSRVNLETAKKAKQKLENKWRKTSNAEFLNSFFLPCAFHKLAAFLWHSDYGFHIFPYDRALANAQLGMEFIVMNVLLLWRIFLGVSSLFLEGILVMKFSCKFWYKVTLKFTPRTVLIVANGQRYLHL